MSIHERLHKHIRPELTGGETEPYEIVYFKLYKTRLKVMAEAIEKPFLELQAA
jgi:hypothetical protein